MSTLEMYIEQAAQCRQEAAGTTLANVRDRFLRSALAWEGMADRVRVTERYRAAEAVRKSELTAGVDRTQFWRGSLARSW